MEYVTLNNGLKMPMEGFGVFQVPDPAQCEQAVLDAIASGYRLIDTAAAYMNEKAVGEAVRKCGVPREELFITTKLWVQDASYEGAKKAIQTSLDNLGLDYLDLYLIHMPFGDYYGSWRAMEELYHQGKVRAIGTSNFLPHHLMNLAARGGLLPMVNQLEYHPGYLQSAAVQYCRENHIQVSAWSPLGRRRLMDDPLLSEIAAAHQVTVPQVCLRFALQNGVLPLPKSSSPKRMRENLDLFRFSLSQEEMSWIATMPQTAWSGEHPDRERAVLY